MSSAIAAALAALHVTVRALSAPLRFGPHDVASLFTISKSENRNQVVDAIHLRRAVQRSQYFSQRTPPSSVRFSHGEVCMASHDARFEHASLAQMEIWPAEGSPRGSARQPLARGRHQPYPSSDRAAALRRPDDA